MSLDIASPVLHTLLYPGQQLLAQCEEGPWILAQLVPSQVDETVVSGWIQRFVRTASGEVVELSLIHISEPTRPY